MTSTWSELWTGLPTSLGESLLRSLLHASVVGALWLALAALLTTVLRKHPALVSFLWWCALTKVLLLLLIPTLRLPVLPAARTAVETAVESARALDDVPQSAARSSAPDLRSSPVAPPGTVGAEPPGNPAPSWWPLAACALWGFGLLLHLKRLGSRHRRLRRILGSSTAVTDPRIRSAFDRIVGPIAQASVALRQSSEVDGVLVARPHRPVVLLAESALEKLSDTELELVLRHELTHLERRDLWLGMVPALTQTLFYFHPLVRLATREYRLARESACDSALLVQGVVPRDYGRLLLKLATSHEPLASMASAAARGTLKRRLKMLNAVRHPTPKALFRLAAFLGVVILLPITLGARSPQGSTFEQPPAPEAIASPAVPEAVPAEPEAPADLPPSATPSAARPPAPPLPEKAAPLPPLPPAAELAPLAAQADALLEVQRALQLALLSAPGAPPDKEHALAQAEQLEELAAQLMWRAQKLRNGELDELDQEQAARRQELQQRVERARAEAERAHAQQAARLQAQQKELEQRLAARAAQLEASAKDSLAVSQHQLEELQQQLQAVQEGYREAVGERAERDLRDRQELLQELERVLRRATEAREQAERSRHDQAHEAPAPARKLLE